MHLSFSWIDFNILIDWTDEMSIWYQLIIFFFFAQGGIVVNPSADGSHDGNGATGPIPAGLPPRAAD